MSQLEKLFKNGLISVTSFMDDPFLFVFWLPEYLQILKMTFVCTFYPTLCSIHNVRKVRNKLIRNKERRIVNFLQMRNHLMIQKSSFQFFFTILPFLWCLNQKQNSLANSFLLHWVKVYCHVKWSSFWIYGIQIQSIGSKIDCEKRHGRTIFVFRKIECILISE